MLIEHNGKRPIIDESARIAPNAVLVGDVTVGAETSIGYGAVLTAESGPITIGANCVVMENAVLRGTRQFPLTLGDNVLVGPHAYLCGCTVENEVFLATGSSVFNGACIGTGAEVRINAVVHLSTRLAPGDTVPIGWVAVGDPAQILPAERHDEIWAHQEPLKFTKTVFGIDHPPPGETMMSAITGRYSRSLLRHCNDKEI